MADSQVQAVIGDGVTRMVFDLPNVDYVDSAGLGMMVYVYGALNEKTAPSVFVGYLRESCRYSD